MFELDLQKAERNQRSNCQHLLHHRKARKFQKSIHFYFTHYAKAFDCVDHDKLWKTLEDRGIPNHLTCLMTNLYACQEATVKTRHGTPDWSKLGKEYIKAIHYHPAYLTYMPSTSCEMSGQMKQKLESRLPGEILITSDMQMTPPSWQKSEEELKSLERNCKSE